MSSSRKESVTEFYGQTVQHKSDFKVKFCNLKAARNKEVKEAEKLVHEMIKQRYFGCGIIAPEVLEGLNVLDLGCGSGMDCFVLSKVVGPSGFVTGVDMTEEQLNYGRRFTEYHTQLYGYNKCNVSFVQGDIEDLKSAGIKDSSQDVIISNCVICLVPNKEAVYREAFRVLTNGGELYFSDMYANKPIPEEMKNDEEMWGNGLTEALTWEELKKITRDIGFTTPLLVSSSPVTITDSRIKATVDQYGLEYVSATFRLFKCSNTAVDECDTDYLTVTYKGGIPGHDRAYSLALNLTYQVDCPTNELPEIYSVLFESRMSHYFTFEKKSIDVNPFVSGSVKCS